jgi:hypothetical protein
MKEISKSAILTSLENSYRLVNSRFFKNGLYAVRFAAL